MITVICTIPTRDEDEVLAAMKAMGCIVVEVDRNGDSSDILRIHQHAADHFNIDSEHARWSRKPDAVAVRATACHIARHTYAISYRQLGLFYSRDHVAVTRETELVDLWLDRDKAYRLQYKVINSNVI